MRVFGSSSGKEEERGCNCSVQKLAAESGRRRRRCRKWIDGVLCCVCSKLLSSLPSQATSEREEVMALRVFEEKNLRLLRTEEVESKPLFCCKYLTRRRRRRRPAYYFGPGKFVCEREITYTRTFSFSQILGSISIEWFCMLYCTTVGVPR